MSLWCHTKKSAVLRQARPASICSADSAAVQDLFLGSGGLIGMSAALLGEAVPGHGSAIAVGNAMSMGPPVFHLPQPLIDSIISRAAAGDADMQQLELDMFR